MVCATWSDLLAPHRKAWDFWRKDVKTHPLALPKIIRTTAVAEAPFALQGNNWELRCAEVRHASRDVIDVATGMTLAR
jgi:hypothetical protein